MLYVDNDVLSNSFIELNITRDKWDILFYSFSKIVP